MYNRCYESPAPLFSSKEGQPLRTEAIPIGADRHGAIFHGGRFVYAPEAEARRPVVYYLSASIRGESRHRYVRRGEVEYWRKRALAWRRFMKAMASWVKVNKEIERELREIGRLRSEPLPGGKRG